MPKGVYVRRTDMGFWKKSQDFRQRVSLKMIGNQNAKGKLVGAKHPNWKGDDVGYDGIHSWFIRNHKKPKRCERCCKVKPLDAANISGEYKRDRSDWWWLCRLCHMETDGRIKRRGRDGRFTKKKT